MVGKYKLELYNKKLRYSMEIKRKYTILRGNSATGKSEFFDMLLSARKGLAILECDVKVLPATSINALEQESGCIIVLDEDDIGASMNSDDFLSRIKASDNYFILITRLALDGLPIALKEIYELTSYTKDRVDKPYTETTLKQRFNEGSYFVHKDKILSVLGELRL